MFSSGEFVEEWNQIFSFKIKETDLAKPTETFVFNALVNYLKMFNFDTAPMIQMKNSENAVERRSFLIRFCHYIDHIYKISDKSHCFLYYDLQHPAPKKTVHMLNHLLNYLFYYNMFKESVVPLANSRIRQRDDLIDKINKLKHENEQIEIKAKMIEKSIEDYRALVPRTSSELNDLVATEAAEKDSICALEEQINNCNTVLESLRNQEVVLTMEIVSQEEVDRLLTSKNTLTNAIAEKEAYACSTYARNQERSATVAKLQSIVASIDKAMDLNPPSSLETHKKSNAKFKELEAKFNEISRKKENLMKIHDKLLEDLKRTQKDVAVKLYLLKKMKAAAEKEIEETKMLADTKEASLGDFEHELHTLETELQKEEDVTEFILVNTAELVKATVANCLDSKPH